MTHDQAKTHFGIYPSDSKPRALQIGRLLIMSHWGDACWDTLTHKNECNTDFIAVRKIRNLDGLSAYQLVCWRLVLTWGLMK